MSFLSLLRVNPPANVLRDNMVDSCFHTDSQNAPGKNSFLLVGSRTVHTEANRNISVKRYTREMQRWAAIPGIFYLEGLLCEKGKKDTLLKKLPSTTNFWVLLLDLFEKELNFRIKHCSLSHLHSSDWTCHIGNVTLKPSFPAQQILYKSWNPWARWIVDIKCEVLTELIMSV